MDGLRQWALCVIIAASVAAIAGALAPKGSTDKLFRSVIGIFVVSAVCIPLFRIDCENINIPDYDDSYFNQIEYEKSDEYMISLFKSELENEILSVAAQYGAEAESVNIDISADEECIIIHSIQICIHNSDDVKLADFINTAEEKLGAPVTLTG